MVELNFTDGIDDAAKSARLAGEEAGKMAEEAIDDALSGINTTDFESFLGGDSVGLTPDGKLTGADGKEVDPVAVSERLKVGDMEGVLKEFGMPDSIAKENADVFDTFQNDFNANENVRDIKSLDTSMNESGKVKDMTRKPPPKTAEDFENQLKDNPKLNDVVNKIFKDGKNKASAGKKFGRFVKIAIAAAAFTGIVALFEETKKHQNRLNGCWLMPSDPTSGKQKCKLAAPMTCNNDCLTASGVKLCSNPQTGCANKGVCGTYNASNNNCFIAGTTCVNCGTSPNTCDTKLPACSGSTSCSPFCDASKVPVPSGYTLKCVNTDFWGALDDMMGGGVFGDIGSAIEKILKIVAIVVVVVVAIVISINIVKFFKKKIIL